MERQPQSLSTGRPYGDAGDAIDWVCDHLPKGDDPRLFLEDWRADRMTLWADYSRWVKLQQTCAAESRALKSKEQSK